MARVFISYSHQDEAWKDRVAKQLRVLEGVGLDVWEDRKIAAGDDWQPEIEQAIARCDVALLLVSADFLTSKFILGQEVPPLLQRRQDAGIRVIPVILKPCQWTRIPWLKPIQARPRDGKPLSGMTEHDAEQALATLAGEVHDLLPSPLAGERPGERPGERGKPFLPPEKVHLTHLPAGAPHFLGREAELAALDTAWRSAGRTAVVELIAPGGTGKTALAKRWVEKLKNDGWHGAQRVFAWSFYSQGTGDDRQASEDPFLAEAIDWFGLDPAPALNPADKGHKLAEAVAAGRTLLILDGLEPLQHPPGPLAGGLRAPGVQALLTHLASAGHPGLCVLTSREWLKDLDEWVRGEERPDGAVLRIDLGNLNEADGARLLHREGAVRAGEAAIAADDAELREASKEVQGHALTLTLLGRYLALAHAGDIRKRDQVKFREADAEATGGHAFRVIAAYAAWLACRGEDGARELAALRLLGLFDRPAAAPLLAALREPPAIPGLTEPLQDLSPAQWHIPLQRLQAARLLEMAPNGGLDAHPLIREWFAADLASRHPEAWRAGHRRLYEYLKTHTPHRPDDLPGLQPLYQAVAHGCRAGVYQEALYEVYVDRILRGAGADGFYSTKKLGAIGADLGVVACFFAEPWRRPAPALAEHDQAWLLNQAATRLRALGRLVEALEPMRAGAERLVAQEDWKNAAQCYGNLSELQLSLGRVAEAIANAGRSVDYADRSGDAFQRISKRTALADARHQAGETAAARTGFAEAEAMQAEWQSEYPMLYSLRGFRYCDLMLAEAEREVWWGEPGSVPGVGWVDARKPNTSEAALGFMPQPNLREVDQVDRRTRQTLAWVESKNWLLTIALDRLTLARCTLYADRLQARPPGDEAQAQTEAAVAGLRAAGDQMYRPLGLLTRAWLRHALNDPAGTQADLAEAQRIAARGGMRLHLADIALSRARLFHDRAALTEARRLIEECGYGRRLPELEDAEAVAKTWREEDAAGSGAEAG